MMEIFGTTLPENEFRLTSRPTTVSAATFVAVIPSGVTVTRRVSDLFILVDETPVVAHWHGQYRTDAFKTSVGHLKKLAEEYKD